MIKQNTVRRLLMAVGIAAAASVTQAQPGTSFTYQGQLKNNGTLVDTVVVVDFALFDAAAGGTQIGSTISQPITPDEGTFSTDLDFGVAAFADNQALWLEIVVNGDQLGRQKLTAAPFALNTRGIAVESGGEVGIGTSAPETLLHMDGGSFWISGTTGGNLPASAGRGLRMWNESSLDVPVIQSIDWTTGAGIGIGQDLLIQPDGGRIGIRTLSPSNVLSVNGTADFAGNVGIGGNVDPLISLTVHGGVLARAGGPGSNGVSNNGYSFIKNTGGDNDSGMFSTGDGDVELWTNNTPRLTIGPDGNVGIGTDNPANLLELAGVTNPGLVIDNTADANTRWGVLARSNDVLAVRDIFDGREVADFARTASGTRNEFRVWDGDGTAQIRAVMGDSAVRSDAGRMFVLRGNTIGSIMDFEADGTAFVQIDIYFTNSDERLKENIETLADPIETIEALRGVSYDRIDGSSYNKIGFIAQEVEQILPQFVNTDSEGMKSVAYDRMTAVLVEAVKAQQAEIDTLKAQRSVAGASYAVPMLIGGAAFGGLALIRRRTK